MENCMVKLKATDGKRWEFLTTAGTITHLRLHAAVFTSRQQAEQVAAQLEDDNPGIETKVVPA